MACFPRGSTFHMRRVAAISRLNLELAEACAEYQSMTEESLCSLERYLQSRTMEVPLKRPYKIPRRGLHGLHAR
jgi:hypothetical protein